MRGSIVKRGAGWSIVYRAPDPETGKTKQVWRGGFTTKRSAEDALKTIVRQVDDGSYVKPVRQTVHQFITEDWLPSLDAQVAAGNLRPSTVAQYRTLATVHLLDREHGVGGVYLQALSPTHLNKLYGRLLTSGRRDGKGGLSPTTVHAVHVTMSRALKDAGRWGKLTRNVAALADPPQPGQPGDSDNAEPGWWSAEQLRLFLTRVSNERLFAMWVLFATTGLRRGEVAGLRWQDLDLDAGVLNVRQTRVVVNYEVKVSAPKTRKSRRTVSLDSSTVAALKAHRKCQLEERMAWGPAWHDSGLVFTREDGSPIHPERLTQLFQRHAKAAGLPVIPLHGARHSYATAALEAGEDIKVLSARLGHSSIGITGDIYQHVTERLDQRSADRTARYILGDPSAGSC